MQGCNIASLPVQLHCWLPLPIALGILRSTMQHLAPCRYFKQVLQAHTDNTAPNVVLLHQRVGDVCGHTVVQ